ncbi:MAG: hypothetical protein KC466_13555 [Myxococcales bacterium]|nr:hypothetical protein [Myxococcales bacterium]
MQPAMMRVPDTTLRGVVSGQLEALAGWAALPEARRQTLRSVFECLTAGALDRPPSPPFSGLSRINADGLPFQWSLAVGAAGRSVRFLCEAGMPGTSARARYRTSRERLWKACEILDVSPPTTFDNVVVRRLMPDVGDWPAHWRSGLWFGVGATAEGIGLKPYLNLNRGAPIDRWRRVGRILQDLGRSGALKRLCDLSGLVSQDSWPVGAAVDLLPRGGIGRVKIYFRSGVVDRAWLARWYDAVRPTEAPAVAALLDAFSYAGRAPYPDRAFTVSLEWHPGDDEPTLKTDLAATRWIASDRDLVAGTTRLLSDLGLDVSEYFGALRALGALPADPSRARTHRFIGLGFEPDGTRHVNVYLEPTLPSPPTPRERSPRRGPAEALDRALAFLIHARSGDHWRDFRLPVGVASSWVTAWTLVHTAWLPRTERAAEFEPARLEAIDWLTRVRTERGGWSYHPAVPDDADSTSLAILALAARGRPAPRSAVDLLRRCVRPDGGVATYPREYPPGGAWIESVPDVTAVAARALGLAGDGAARANAIDYLLRVRRADGTWPSYWWRAPIYATWAALEAMGDALAPEDLGRLLDALTRLRPVGAFETALHAMCLGLLRDRAGQRRAVASLLETQLPDGSWPSDPKLRLSHPHVARPWELIDSGPLYEDHLRVFTTAAVVGALTSLESDATDDGAFG